MDPRVAGFQDARVRPFRPRGAVSDWVQILQTEQANDAPSDPGTMLASSSFSRSTGLFTMTPLNAFATTIDGFRENIPAWSLPVRTLFPAFDPLYDMLELYTQIVALPLNASRYGPLVGVADASVGADRSALVVSGVGIWPTSTTVINAGCPTTTGISNTAVGSDVNPATAVFQRIWWSDTSSPLGMISAQVYRSGTVPIAPAYFGGTNTFSSSVQNWRIMLGLLHVTTTAATANTVSWKTWARQVRIGTLTPS